MANIVNRIYGFSRSMMNIHRTLSTPFKEANLNMSEEELDATEAYNRKLARQKDAAAKRAAKTIPSFAIGMGLESYSLVTSFSRFGLRGQDIQDQKNLQDHLVGMAGSIGISYASMGLVGGTISTAGLLVNEAIQVSKDVARYNYNKSIDASQKDIIRERIGSAALSCSRRR